MAQIDVFKPKINTDNYIVSKIEKEFQVVEFDLETSGYKDIIVQKDIPVKLIINAKKSTLTGCNYQIVSKKLNIDKVLVEGENVIIFTPSKEGDYLYTCYMIMLKNNIKVIDDIDYFKKEN